MSAHGFLQHVENRHRAAEDCKLLMAARIPRVNHAGVRLTPMNDDDAIAKNVAY
jgi:hypothetical protein